MLDKEFLSAVVPEPTQILGLKLRPFCLGHLLLLLRLDNGFLRGEPTWEAFLQGVAVCSMTWEEGCEFLANPDEDKLQKWMAHVRRQMLPWHTRLLMRIMSGVTGYYTARFFTGVMHRICTVDRMNLFTDYLQKGLRTPNYMVEDAAKGVSLRSTKVPSPEVLRVTLMSELGLSESAVMNRYLPLSHYDCLCWRDVTGKGVELLPEAEAQQTEALAKQADELLARVKAQYGIRS